MLKTESQTVHATDQSTNQSETAISNGELTHQLPGVDTDVLQKIKSELSQFETALTESEAPLESPPSDFQSISAHVSTGVAIGNSAFQQAGYNARWSLESQQLYSKYDALLNRLAPSPGRYVYVAHDQPLHNSAVGRNYVVITRFQDGHIKLGSNVTATNTPTSSHTNMSTLVFHTGTKAGVPFTNSPPALKAWDRELHALQTAKSLQNVTELERNLRVGTVQIDNGGNLGTGFIVNNGRNGRHVVITNKHVLRNAAYGSKGTVDAKPGSLVQVKTADNRIHSARVVALSSQGKDIAALEFTSPHRTYSRLPLAQTDSPAGSPVAAFGFPSTAEKTDMLLENGTVMNFGSTITAGSPHKNIEPANIRFFQSAIQKSGVSSIANNLSASPGLSGAAAASPSTGKVLGMTAYIVNPGYVGGEITQNKSAYVTGIMPVSAIRDFLKRDVYRLYRGR